MGAVDAAGKLKPQNRRAAGCGQAMVENDEQDVERARQDSNL
jgi:hypothetical protein